MKARPLVYYVTAHGYGHAARTCDILRGLLRRFPEIPVVIVSDLAESFFRSRLDPDRFSWRRGRFDVGLVQLDSVRADIEATLREWDSLLPVYDALIEAEANFLHEVRAGAVAADLPALPFEAAARVGAPSIGVGNFGWDWIYADYVDRDPRWGEVVERVERGYRQAELLLHAPFSEPMSTFRRKQPISLVAEPGRERRKEMAKLSGADEAKPWALLSFSTLEWDEAALAKVAGIRDHEFFTMRPLAWEGGNIHAMDRDEVAFADVLASCDVVISKPGFGILSECVVNEKPLIYAERTDFIEYPLLLDGLQRTLKNVHLPADRLYRGELQEALNALASAGDPPERLDGGGADDAARALAEAWARGIG